jgi:hypothetical protein
MTTEKNSPKPPQIPIVMSAGDLLLTLRVRAAMSPNARQWRGLEPRSAVYTPENQS